MVNIIHDDNRQERMKVLLQELNQQGITDYKIWEGVHGEETVIKCINLAHKQIVADAKERGLPSVIIFEDDIRFTDENSFNYWQENKPDEYDIWLGGFYLGVPDEQGILKEFTALHCYEVHERFYDTFLSTNPYAHLDQALSGLGLYKSILPIVAIQHNGHSSNSAQYCNWDIFFQNRVLYKKQ